MVDTTDTIVAIATPPGRGGLGVVRVSGHGVRDIIKQLIEHELEPRHARLSKFRDNESQIIDEGIALFFPMPASYTGEDVLEIHTHGSRIILDQIVERVITLGARQARPGEFTERAFHNNKLDLVQAEAVADLIDAVSGQAVRSAVNSLSGEFSKRINLLLEKLIKLRMQLEGTLDFPEEEIGAHGAEGITIRLEECLSGLASIFRHARQGAMLKEGITAVIAGRPNVGKSTLLNRLAGKEAAIVTDIPGTTRDLIEQDILLDNIPVHIIDTAGLRTTRNKIEQEGIRRTLDAAARADMLIMIYEHGQKPGAEEKKLLDTIDRGKHIIVLYNKIDLSGAAPEIKRGTGEVAEIMLSAKTGAGIDLFVRHLKETLGMQDLSEDVFMARKRHLDALERTRQALENGLDQYVRHPAAELLADDLRLAQQALGEITGEFVSDDLLGEIFRNFCIGK